jgi:hypothetical protein
MSATKARARRPGPAPQTNDDRDRLLEIRNRHVSQPGLRERLTHAHPGGARQAYLEEVLAMSERLAATMAEATELRHLAGDVVAELHHTFGVYLAVIQRLDRDGVLRIVASAGPLAEESGRFLVAEQPVGVGINGRVARTGAVAVVGDRSTLRAGRPDPRPRARLGSAQHRGDPCARVR